MGQSKECLIRVHRALMRLHKTLILVDADTKAGAVALYRTFIQAI